MVEARDVRVGDVLVLDEGEQRLFVEEVVE